MGGRYINLAEYEDYIIQEYSSLNGFPPIQTVMGYCLWDKTNRTHLKKDGQTIFFQNETDLWAYLRELTKTEDETHDIYDI